MSTNLEQYRSYLRNLARGQFGGKLHRRLDSSDLVQDTLIEAHRDFKAFRGQTPEELRAWLRQIMARNLANAIRDNQAAKRDMRKEQEFRSALDVSSAQLEQWTLTHPGQTASGMSDARLVEICDAMEKLPEEYRAVVLLKHWEGLTLAQIAKRLDRTTNSVTGLYHRGLKRLRKLLSDQETD